MAHVHVLNLPANIWEEVDNQMLEYDFLIHDPIGELRVGDVISIPDFLSGAGDCEGLFFVDDSPIEHHFHLQQPDAEVLIFPTRIQQLMTTLDTNLRQYYEDAMHFTLGMEDFEWEDVDLMTDGDVPMGDRALITFPLAECEIIGSFPEPT